MGQYHLTVNLDKREFVDPHKLGAGLKLWEQLANDIGPGKALVVLLAHPDQRGGGDFDVDQNWHGPERKGMTRVGEMPEEYPAIAKRTIGRWRGDRIAIIGDYAEDSDIPSLRSDDDRPPYIYGLCRACEDTPEETKERAKRWAEEYPGIEQPAPYTDVTEDVIKVIEHELNGAFVGTGWRHWVEPGKKVTRRNGQKTQEGEVKAVTADIIEVSWGKTTTHYKRNQPNQIDFY